MVSIWQHLPAVISALSFYLDTSALAILLDIDNVDSIRNAAATAAYSLQSAYTGNRTGGVLGKFPYPPFYWWLSGAAWGGMIGYWRATGDESYYNVTYDALVSQISVTNNFLPGSEKFDEGNDDVAFWAFAAMCGAEQGFLEPPYPYPSWLTICENVFNDYISRWYLASDTCGGGLKWQIFPSSAGFDYKNSISNGGFFQLAARLARFTNNQTYYDWAEIVWDWTIAIGLVDSNTYAVYDGADDTINCTGIDHTQWSYNPSIYLYGAAVLQNYTGGADIWIDRTNSLLAAAISTFTSPFPNATDIMYEQQCEPTWSCNVDQFSFKAYLARWLADTSVMAPQTAATVGAVLRASAIGAASACSGAGDGITCGARWYLGDYDGTAGVGQSLAAMQVIMALLVNETAPPGTIDTLVSSAR